MRLPSFGTAGKAFEDARAAMGMSHYSNNDRQDDKINPVDQKQFNSVTNPIKDLATGKSTPTKKVDETPEDGGLLTDRKPTIGAAKLGMLLESKLSLNLM